MQQQQKLTLPNTKLITSKITLKNTQTAQLPGHEPIQIADVISKLYGKQIEGILSHGSLNLFMYKTENQAKQ